MASIRIVYVHQVLEAYRSSACLISRSQSVRREYGRILDHLHSEIGARRADQLRRADIRGWRDAWARRGHRAATMRLQVLKNSLEPLLSDGALPADLFAKLQRVHRPHGRPEQNPVWTDAEVEAVIEHCRQRRADGLARAVALGRYAGLRRSNICSIREDDRSITLLRGGHEQRRIRCISEKGEQLVDLREDPRLTALLDNTDFMGDTIAYNRRGDPWAPRQLNQALDRVIVRLANEGVVRPGLTLHGLRHTRGVELALAGCSDAELAAQLGHGDEQTAREYRRQASRRAHSDRAQRLVDQERLRLARGPRGDNPTGEPDDST